MTLREEILSLAEDKVQNNNYYSYFKKKIAKYQEEANCDNLEDVAEDYWEWEVENIKPTLMSKTPEAKKAYIRAFRDAFQLEEWEENYYHENGDKFFKV